MKKQFSTLIILLALFATAAKGQKKWIEKLTSKEPDTTRSASLLPLPVIGYAQETGFEFGLAVLYSFYTDKKDTVTRNSSINTVATLTSKGQSNFFIKTDLWSPQNKYHYLSEIRYRNFPFDFYGTGDNTLEKDKDKLNQKLVRIQGEVEKQLAKFYYGGVNANFESYSFRDKEDGGIYTQDLAIQGKSGGKVLFLGISQILDTRNTNTYTTKGSYLKLSYAYAPDIFGNDNFTGGLFSTDFRVFRPAGRKGVVGLQVFYKTLQGSNSPFYLLPQLGNDQLMRGYYGGRYRDQNLLALQSEFRYRFIPRLGVAAFAGAGNVFQNKKFDLNTFKPSYGGGLRYFFDPERDLSVRFDYGIGEKRPGEERQKGFYISFGEAF